MKKSAKILIFLLITALLAACLAGCDKAPDGTDEPQKTAAYASDTELGDGKATIYVEVKTPDGSVTFTIHTDKQTVGEALLEHNLIAGDEGEYGLYVKTVNGVLADYDIDQSYWSFCRDGEVLPVGVDGETVTDGAHYELVYTK